MKNKHLTLSDRITIQEMLERNQSFRAIAKALDKSVTSISREIRRNRYKKSKANFRALCVKTTDCRLTHLCGDDSCRNFCAQCMEVCNTDKCPEYEPRICPNHNNAPFVCNGCDEEKRRQCRYERYYYDARLAQSAYEKTLSSSREGVSLSVDEMERIIPQGKNFDILQQSDADLIANNINSYPRVNLNNTTPYKLAELLIGKPFLENLGYYEISRDEVILKPSLLDKRLR